MDFAERKNAMQNKAARRVYEYIEKKKSNLILSLDVTEPRRFFDILESTAPYLIMLKTHIDIVNGFDADFLKRLLLLQEKHDFFIFEDRKFADIGNTVKLQYTSGFSSIIRWADFVTAHIFPGPSVIEGLKEAWKESSFADRGCFILPQMTSRRNLFY